MRIKNVLKQSKDGIKIGPFGSALTNKTIGKGEFNVYSQANLIASDFLSTKNTVDSNTFEELKNYEVFPGDICLSMMGTIINCYDKAKSNHSDWAILIKFYVSR